MLTDEQVMIRDMARDYAQGRLAPGAQAREKAGVIGPEIVTELGELGFLGMTIDPAWGGAGADYVLLRAGADGDRRGRRVGLDHGFGA